MRSIPTAMRNLWEQGGPFIGTNGAVHGRVTVEENWQLNTTSSISTSVPSKLPFRWWQHLDNDQTEIEIPNVKSIAMDRSLDADAATCEITIYNQWMDENTDPNDDPRELGSPGFFTWNYGQGDAAVRWGQSDSPWNDILIPNALIRVYQGFGGREKSIEDALDDGNIILMGVFLVDEVRVGTDGMLSLRCRDMAKLLIEQQMFPPLMPNGWYPLHYYRWVYTTHQVDAVEVYDWMDPDPGVQAEHGQGNEGRKYIPDAAFSSDGAGYWLVGTDGGVFSFGVPFYGSRGDEIDPAAFASMASDPLGRGYWICTTEGHIYTFGEVLYYGGLNGGTLSPVTRMAAHPNGRGYWLLTADGHVFNYGEADDFGDSAGATGTDMIDICPTPSGNGYWLLSRGGAIFTHGDALYYGGVEDDVSGLDPAAALTARSDGLGYWVASYAGNVHARGVATSFAANGDYVAGTLNDPITAIISTPTDLGYALVSGDGGVYSFGDAPFWGSLPGGFTYTTKADGDYLDYADIVKDFLRWSGWLAYGDGGDFVYGNIESTGAYAEDEIPPDTFDKKPVIDALNTIKEIVGYHLWVDEEGAIHFESPNWYQYGNLDEDGVRVEALVEIDEKYQLTDYTVSYTDSSVRSEIIISSHDPTAALTGTVTTRQSYQNDLLRGMVRPAMWVNDVLTSETEQRAMLERIEDHIQFSYRMGTVECVANPQIQINDQVRIYERQTGETFVHYVRGISSQMNLDSGEWLMTITTNWLGEDWVDEDVDVEQEIPVVNNNAPVAVLSDSTLNVDTFEQFTLSAAASYDPDGDPITYHWSVIQQPTGSTAALVSGSSSNNKKFTADLEGTYRIRVTVLDDGGAARGNSSPAMGDTADCIITATNSVVGVGSLNAYNTLGVYRSALTETAVAQFESSTGINRDLPGYVVVFYTGSTWSSLTTSVGSLGTQFQNRCVTLEKSKLSLSVVPYPPTAAAGTYTIAQAAAGAYDANYVLQAQALAVKGFDATNLVIRPMWEFNGNYFLWSILGTKDATCNPTSFAAAFRRIVDAWRSVIPGLKVDWCVKLGGDTSEANVELAYPGDAYVDIIGNDHYDWYVGYTAGRNSTTQNAAFDGFISQQCGLQWQRDFAVDHDKLCSFPEWGAHHDPRAAYTPYGGDDNPIFIERTIEWIDDLGAEDRLAYHSYFEHDAADGWHKLHTLGGSAPKFAMPLAKAKFDELLKA